MRVKLFFWGGDVIKTKINQVSTVVLNRPPGVTQELLTTRGKGLDTASLLHCELRSVLPSFILT